MSKKIKVSEKGRLTREMIDARTRAQFGNQYTDEDKDNLVAIISQYQVAPEDVFKPATVPYQPSQNATFLLYICTPAKNRDALLGDLEEEYKKAYTRFGDKRANFFLWIQVFTSIWPLVSGWCKKPLTYLSNWVQGIAAEAIKRKIG